MNSLDDIHEWANHNKNISDFRQSVRASVRALWQGNFTLFAFVDDMTLSIRRNLTQAWHRGAATCGLQPDELSPNELQTLNNLINSQFPFLLGFGDDIESSQALGPLFQRAEVWINRYNESFEQGKAMACADQKGKWIVGATDHCRSCAGFNGRVYRFSKWESNGALPRKRALCCGGFNCDCTIEQTNDKITPGPFPSSLLC